MLGLTTPARPRLAYGFWRYSEDEGDLALAILEQARAGGIEHLDMADCYGGPDGFGGAERLLGALRKRAPSLFAGASLATKAGVEFGAPYNSSPDYLAAACEASLKRLGVERIDLFYVHRPDVLTHPQELARTLDRLVDQGKVARVGVSNFTTAQIGALTQALRAPLSALQIELSAGHVAPLFDGTLDLAMQMGAPVLAWSPLAGGRLVDEGEAFAAVRGKLAEIATLHEAPVEAAALAFLLRHPAGVTPIVGTKSPERLAACLAAPALSLSRQEWYAIVEAALGHRLP
jgi:predicted oxidoreductase